MQLIAPTETYIRNDHIQKRRSKKESARLCMKLAISFKWQLSLCWALMVVTIIGPAPVHQGAYSTVQIKEERLINFSNC